MAIDVPILSALNIVWSMGEQTSTETTTTTVLHGKAANNALMNASDLSQLGGERMGDYGFYAGHVVRTGYGREFDEIDLTAIELNVPYKKAGYWSRFEAVARTESRPLEEKLTKIGDNDETYAVWWNHDVRAADDATALTAGQITTLKGYTSLSSGTGLTGYYWAKSNQALKKGEKVMLDARFPGVQGYGVGAEQIKEIIFARDLSTVQTIIQTVGYLKYPEDHSGTAYDSTRVDSSKWLITSATYRKKYGWYEAEVTYAYAKNGWLAQSAVAPATGVYPEA